MIVETQKEKPIGLRFGQHGAIFLFACALLVSRRPDAVFHAQFWADDGRVWRYPAFQDLHFADYAKCFEAAPVGTAVTIPENPAGWTVRLVKHPPGR